MKKKMFLAVLLLCGLLVFAGCGGNNDAPITSGSGDIITGERDFIEFSWYFNYEWMPAHPWGGDVVSAYWGEKFNVHINTASPDANAAEVMNLMIVSGDLPDAIWMERDSLNVEMTRMGLFYSIDELVDMVDNNWYHENVPASTQRHYEVDGVNHVIPNWVRMGEIGKRGGATGGNQAWMKVTNVYEAVGSPEIVTFEDLYDYAVLVRDAGLTNHAGTPIIPVLFNGGDNSGQEFVNIIFLAMGG